MNDMKAPNYDCKYFESKNILFDDTHKCVTDGGSQVKVGIFWVSHKTSCFVGYDSNVPVTNQKKSN